MKFILNTSVDPHFCALFDDSGQLVASHQWEIRRRDGVEVFSFLEKHLDALSQLHFLGGVAGPGGFSSLRVANSVLQSLAFRFELPIHSIRADRWISEWLGHERFLLNSFSDSVWECESGELKRISLAAANEKFSAEKFYLAALPVEKQKLLPNIVFMRSPKDSLEIALLRSLKQRKASAVFIPDYEFPAVNTG